MLKPVECQPCYLYNRSQGFSRPDGKGTSGVALIGEGLGHEEMIDGLPFRPRAQAGSMLEAAFRYAGLERNQFLLWNVIGCKPPNNQLAGASYEREAIASCSVHFNRVIGGFKTHLNRTLVALGNIPLTYTTSASGDSEAKQSISYLRGYPLQSKWGTVVPSYHPSFLRRGNPNFLPVLAEDLKKAIRIANGSLTQYPHHPSFKWPDYQINPSLDELQSFYYKVKDNQKLILAVDIETPTSRDVDEDQREELTETDIIQIQFSTGKGTGIAAKFSPPYLDLIRALLQTPNVKIGHNYYEFDEPRLDAKGYKTAGKVHDTMWMFKHWHPRLERNLQSVVSLFDFPFPWKHLFDRQLEWYGCADVDACHWIIAALPRLMKQRGVWEGYIDEVFTLHYIMKDASNRGIPVNDIERQNLKVTFQQRIDEYNNKLQSLIPDEIRNVTPRRGKKGSYSYGYKKTPKLVKDCEKFYNLTVPKLKAQGKTVVDFETFVKRKTGLVLREFIEIDKETAEPTTYKRWCKLQPFKASADQVKRYITWKANDLLKEPKEKVKVQS